MRFGIAAFAVAGVCAIAGVAGLRSRRSAPDEARPPQLSHDHAYAYGGVQFSQFVSDSLRRAKLGNAPAFYDWMDAAYRRAFPDDTTFAGWPAKLETIRRELAETTSTDKRSERETEFAAWTHRAIKKCIPRFSLDRGFEFANTMKLGERQCFLQAVLIAGMLQSTGMQAGVVMVYRNIEGAASNNGHALTLLKLSNGHDLEVDASEPEPFARHQGLFVRERRADDYRFVEPRFDGGSPDIVSYRITKDGSQASTDDVEPLDVPFIRSQFNYYRGERAPGGVLASRPTAAGLKASVAYFQASQADNSQNPLNVYMLGRAYAKQGRLDISRPQIDRAYKLYRRTGWIPDGLKDAMKQFGVLDGR